MKVTEDQLRSYIEAFHNAIGAIAKRFLPPEYRGKLFHAALLPARITGLISTQGGVAIEYERASTTKIQIVKGNSSIEDLFVQAPTRLRSIGPMLRIAARDIRVAKLTMKGGFPFRFSTDDASVSFEDVGFEIGSWRREILFAEIFADSDTEQWSSVQAYSRAKDEVLAAMVHVGRAQERNLTLSEYIATFKDRTVLVLGAYEDGGIDRLNMIAGLLSSLGYEPLLVKDIPDHPHQDLTQKVVAIGAVSRFIIVEDSSKSGHLLEVQLCKQNSWITIILRVDGKGSSWMTAGASYASNVILELAYNPSLPDAAITEAIQWAEAKIKELEVSFESTYPWRSGNDDGMA